MTPLMFFPPAVLQWRSPTFLLLLVLLTMTKHAISGIIPIISKIPHHGKECYFETVEDGEHITVSLFVVEGTKLATTAVFEGPIAPIENEMTSEFLGELVSKKYMPRKSTRWVENIDFMSGLDEKVHDDDDFWDDDEGMGIKQRAKKEQRIDELKMKMKTNREIGDAFEKTVQVKSTGWYRVCVSGVGNSIAFEVDIRKSSDLGLNKKNGHVYTAEQKALLDFEKNLFPNAANNQDLQRTKLQMSSLHRLLVRIKDLQKEERHRMKVHNSINVQSSDKMRRSAIFETGILISLTMFQIYVIRSWFGKKNKSLLG